METSDIGHIRPAQAAPVGTEPISPGTTTKLVDLKLLPPISFQIVKDTTAITDVQIAAGHSSSRSEARTTHTISNHRDRMVSATTMVGIPPITRRTVTDTTAMCRHRTNYQEAIPPTSLREKLNKIGFCWDVYEGGWQARFEDLKKFKETNGHVNVKTSKTGLFTWIQTQRGLYKKYVRENKGAFVKHTHRIKLLEDIGVDLDPSNIL